MAEESFPVLEQPMSDTQWKSVARAFGTGVMDEGGNPYNLTNLSNINNTATIAVDTRVGYNHAVVSGFYHKMDTPVTVSLPAVSSTTTYYVALRYDPTDKAMPVKLVAVTSLDTSGGKEYLVLWEVTRNANQLLTDSARVKKRPIISPTLVVDTPSALPAATSVLWGTRAFAQQTGQEFRASYTSWIEVAPHQVPLLEMPGWGMRQITKGIAVTPGKDGFQCSARFALARTAEGYNLNPAFNNRGTTLGTLIPAGYRPTENVHFLANSGDRLLEGFIAPSGALQLRSIGGTHYIATGNGLTISINWFVPKTY